MSRTLLTIVLAAVMFLPGCTTRPERAAAPSPACDCAFEKDLAARRQAYERILTPIKPGTTRRKLYDLLPPASPPNIGDAIFSMAGVFLVALVSETYPLDKDFSLSVTFTPVNPLAALKPGRPGKSRSTASVRHSSDAKSIDQLLFGPSEKSGPFEQSLKLSPDDKVAGSPKLLLRNCSASCQDSRVGAHKSSTADD